MRIERYRRHFALYDGDDLVALFVYRKGAVEVKHRLEQLARRTDSAIPRGNEPQPHTGSAATD